jgi:nucleotide-binding universal stress UspA family protein
MTLVVPFDGSGLSKAALVRAAQFERVLGETVVVVSVIPNNNARYARERDWIGSTDPFDTETVVSLLRDAVTELAPTAEFHPLFVDKYAARGTIANRIRKFARDHDASMMFLGSENAGRVVSALTVGQSIAGGHSYDKVIVSTESLPKIDRLEAELPAEETLS